MEAVCLPTCLARAGTRHAQRLSSSSSSTLCRALGAGSAFRRLRRSRARGRRLPPARRRPRSGSASRSRCGSRRRSRARRATRGWRMAAPSGPEGCPVGMLRGVVSLKGGPECCGEGGSELRSWGEGREVRCRRAGDAVISRLAMSPHCASVAAAPLCQRRIGPFPTKSRRARAAP